VVPAKRRPEVASRPGSLRAVVPEDHPLGRPRILATAQHQDRPVGVVYHRLGDAPQGDAPHGTQAPAADHYKPRPDLPGEIQYLIRSSSLDEVGTGDKSSGVFYPLHSFF
jgi:hypothetical protein